MRKKTHCSGAEYYNSPEREITKIKYFCENFNSIGNIKFYKNIAFFDNKINTTFIIECDIL